jgi:DNA-binding transcriptional LysR family regulator
MDLRRLRYFAVTAAEGSIHAAAARLSIAQPALSRQIRDLEAELDAALFQRSARGVKLTPAGEVLVKEVERLFVELDLAISRTKRASRGQVGHLRIGLTLPSAELKFVSAAFAASRREFEDVDFAMRLVSSDQQIEALHRGEIDVGVFYRRSLPLPNVQHADIWVDNYKLMVSTRHRYADRVSVRLADIGSEELIFATAPSWTQWPETRAEIMSAFLAARVIPRRITEEINYLPAIVNLVAEDVGVSIMNSSVELAYPDAGVAFVPIDDLTTPLHLCVAWRRDDQTPVMHRFVALLIEHAAVERSAQSGT